jgi:ABC-type dipeptide/oligopeptide/nickel transport system ATPase subunit
MLLIAHQMLNDLAHSIRNDIHWGLLMSNDLRWLKVDSFLAGGELLYRGGHMHPLGDSGKGGGDPGQLDVAANGTVVVTISGVNEVAFGKEDATEAEIREASRLARVSDFVGALPAEYETRIGDRGVLLSGGQRQRIALARALVKNPPILILDEATSMFDEESEASFLRDIEVALAQRTVIWITHRATCLELADRIVQLEAGKIREVQPHRELQL